MKNRHGVDVKIGQRWVSPLLGVSGTVVRIYSVARGHSVVLRHIPIWGYTESHFPLSAFSNRRKAKKTLYLKHRTTE